MAPPRHSRQSLLWLSWTGLLLQGIKATKPPERPEDGEDALNARPAHDSHRALLPVRGAWHDHGTGAIAVLAQGSPLRRPGTAGVRRLYGSRQLGDRHRGRIALREHAAV